MKLNNDERLGLHSGEYVQVLASVPENRFDAVIPLLELKKNDRLVDFACGNGLLAELIGNNIGVYEGVDFSSDFINAAITRSGKNGLTNTRFHCMDIVSFCRNHPNEYDIVTAFDFSEHIYDEDFVKIFTGAREILKTGGSLYLYTPNLDFFWERMKDIGLAKQFPQHIAVRNNGQYLHLLQECGFDVNKIHLFKPPHFNVFKYLRPLTRLPVIGRLFEAKLLYRCIK